MHQLQLIGIKTNLESFVTTTLMEHMLNRHQLHLFLWVSKQWGYQTVHGTNPVTYDLPIPFEEAPFTVAISTGNSGNHASCGGFTKTTIVLRAGTTAGVWDTVGFFIIGCQLQWGFDSGTAEKNIVILPLPVINPLSGFACLTDSNGAGDIGIKSMSSTSIVVDVDTNKAASRNFYWLVIAL